MPPDLQQEVLDFAGFMLEKRLKKRGRTLRQDWAGALGDLREQYTSVDLQHKILEWRIGERESHE